MEQYIHEEVKTEDAIHVRFQVYEDSNHLITEHWHRSMEVVYIYEGEMDITVNRRKYCLFAGDFIVINSAAIHTTQCNEHVKVLLLQIPYDFLKHSIPQYDNIQFSMEKHSVSSQNKIRQILTDMGQLYEEKPQGFSLRFSSLLYDFLYTLVVYYQIPIAHTAKVQSQKNLSRLEPVIHYVKKHYRECISLEEVSSLAALNPEYFCRFFKRNMGTTFTAYVNSVRLAHVCEDLKSTDLNIGTILEQHGITNYKLFMKNFKQLYGCTPKEFRRNSS